MLGRLGGLAGKLVVFESLAVGHRGFGLVCKGSRALVVVDPIAEALPEYRKTAEMNNLEKILSLSLQSHKFGLKEIEESLDNEKKENEAKIDELNYEKDSRSIFGFSYLTHNDFALCGMPVKSVFRKNLGVFQRWSVSVVDTSLDSDRSPFLFTGDLFNFHLPYYLDGRKISDSDERHDYFDNLSTLRGFRPEQMVFPSSSTRQTENLLKFGSKILTNTEYANSKLEKKEFIADALFEQRVVNPILNVKDAKVLEIVRTLGLNPENPVHVLKSLHSLKIKLGLNF